MKQFVKAWARGVSICAFLFCISIVTAIIGVMAEALPPIVSVPICIILGPPLIYWASKWLAPDLFQFGPSWWRRRPKSRMSSIP